MKLFLWTVSVENMISVMKLFWFVFLNVVFSRKISDQTFITLYVIDLVLVSTCWFSQELGNTVLAYSHNEGMLWKFLKWHSLVLIDHKTFPDKVFQIFRQIFQQWNVIFHDFYFELILSRTGPWNFSMQNFIHDNSHRPNIVLDRVGICI